MFLYFWPETSFNKRLCSGISPTQTEPTEPTVSGAHRVSGWAALPTQASVCSASLPRVSPQQLREPENRTRTLEKSCESHTEASESLCRTSAEPPTQIISALLLKSEADLFSLLTVEFCWIGSAATRLEIHKVEVSAGFFFSELLVGFIPGFIVLFRQCLGFILHVFSGRQKNEWLLRPAAGLTAAGWEWRLRQLRQLRQPASTNQRGPYWARALNWV